ncbi:MAG: BRCT domain-containing protein [Methylophilus sp.]|nr:BRCT domain-containing protein [Methylophilus sp.]
MAEYEGYARFTTKSRLDKSINTLLGLIEGITIDGKVNIKEAGLLDVWLSEHQELRDRHPYNELIPVIERAVEDGALDEEERKDIQWLCKKLVSGQYYDEVTAGLQVLHGVLGGIASDGQITEAELKGLSDWLDNHEFLKTCWPYDEVASLIMTVLRDGRIDESEHKMLKDFFSEFVSIMDNNTITSPVMSKEQTIIGVCAVCPEIVFEGSSFYLTGISRKYTKDEFKELISKLGGKPTSGVSQKLNYLIIGSEGNSSWAYACYGRKVEAAVNYRKQGAKILIVHENDFHDAVEDL